MFRALIAILWPSPKPQPSMWTIQFCCKVCGKFCVAREDEETYFSKWYMERFCPDCEMLYDGNNCPTCMRDKAPCRNCLEQMFKSAEANSGNAAQ